MSPSPDKLMAFMGKLVGDLGAMMSVGPMLVGEKLGLYKALAKGGSMTAADLAKATETNERYVHEWLCSQAASGFIDYDAASGKFSMNPEQAVALGIEESPFYFLGAIEVALAMIRDEPAHPGSFPQREGRRMA